MWKPSNLEQCLIKPDSLNAIFSCNFPKDNILLKGRAGVGKTTVCRLLVDKYPQYSIIENIKIPFSNFSSNKLIATTTCVDLEIEGFTSVLLEPLSPLNLLKELSKFNLNYSKSLYICILNHYPNINKILSSYCLE